MLLRPEQELNWVLCSLSSIISLHLCFQALGTGNTRFQGYVPVVNASVGLPSFAWVWSLQFTNFSPVYQEHFSHTNELEKSFSVQSFARMWLDFIKPAAFQVFSILTARRGIFHHWGRIFPAVKTKCLAFHWLLLKPVSFILRQRCV